MVAHTPRVSPRAYFYLDRGTKLAALALLTMALVPDFLPQYSLFLGLAAVALALVTVVVQPEDDEEAA